jgi:hypothetical protein
MRRNHKTGRRQSDSADRGFAGRSYRVGRLAFVTALMLMLAGAVTERGQSRA